MIRLPLLAITLLASLSVGCDASSATNDKDHTPAKRVDVTNPRTETSLTAITLSDEARRHLDIRTARVARERIREYVTHRGDVAVPEGRSITISSPLAGTVSASSPEAWPRSGMAVDVGIKLFDLFPSIRADREVLSPADRIALARARADLESAQAQAVGEADAARVRLDAAQTALDRAERLLKENAGSVRAFDEAKTGHRLAKSELDAAQTRLQVLKEALRDLEGVKKGVALPIRTPFAGVLQKLFVMDGEAVAAGSPLCEVISLDPVWIRVPVYVGDLSVLDKSGSAKIVLMGGPMDESLVARPIASPATASSSTATVDRYYEIQNLGHRLVPGQRVKIDIPTVEDRDALVIPWASVVHDIHGGQWVYIARDEGAYARLRVSVRRVEGDRAILEKGLDAGDAVVVEGAAELFGVEFGGAGH